MVNALQVTLVANAGLLLEYNGTKLLLDGIFGKKGHPFSAPSPEMWQHMKEGRPPFDNIDYLLFTHAHPDHFSPEMTLEFLQSRGVKGLFLPEDEAVQQSGLTGYLQQERISCAVLSDQTNHTGYRITPDITVRAFRTLHLDKKFQSVPHFCYLITFGEKKILFTADIDYVNEDLERIRSIRLDAAFVNPLLFGMLRRGRFLQCLPNAQRIVVYHVPFPPEDPMGMRPMLERNLAQWPAEQGMALALQEPFQQMQL